MLALLAAILYLFTDALGHLDDRRLAWQRTWTLVLWGWVQTMIFAAGYGWLGAERLFPIGKGLEIPDRYLSVWGGAIYFDYSIIAGVFAFIIGVFIQILWEDKSITESL